MLQSATATSAANSPAGFSPASVSPAASTLQRRNARSRRNSTAANDAANVGQKGVSNRSGEKTKIGENVAQEKQESRKGILNLKYFLKKIMDHLRPLFLFIFVFSTNKLTILTTNQCEKCPSRIHGAGIRTHDLQIMNLLP